MILRFYLPIGKGWSGIWSVSEVFFGSIYILTRRLGFTDYPGKYYPPKPKP